MSLFENIQIKRLIAHEIYKKTPGDQPDRTPTYSSSSIELPPQVKNALEQRLGQALGSNKYCLELKVTNADEKSIFQMFGECLDVDDERFKTLSQDLTNSLWEAQKKGNIPGGAVVVATGTIGYPEKRFTCVIKAEPHAGFRKKLNKGVINLDYISDLLLTDAQKWCKVAIVIEKHKGSYDLGKRSVSNFDVYAFDAQMKYQDSRIQTTYFVKTFLGCEVADTSKVQTKIFFDVASNTIDSMNIPAYDKVNLSDALNVYLNSTENVLSVRDFAESNFQIPSDQDIFINSFKSSSFPSHGIQKDTTLIRPQLQKRNLLFTNEVKITVPSEQLRELVEIDKDLSNENTTVIRVYGKLKES